MRYALLLLPAQMTDTIRSMPSTRSAPAPSTLAGPVWLFVVLLVMAFGSIAAEPDYSEDEVKAAFLFHFASYADWPADSAAADPQAAITFAVLHAPIIARELERFSEGRTIKGRTVRVRRIRSISQLDGDEVLFIGASQNRRLDQLLRQIEGPTLVVTDAEAGLPEGGMINFQLVGRRVRFEIALPAAQKAGITLSSRLLSAALRVEMSRCHLECRLINGSDRFALGRLRRSNPA